MSGPPPKDPTKRRRRNVPERGEWVDLPPANVARAPKMPTAPRGGWAAGTKVAWRSWWADPASLMWSPADRSSVAQLASLHHEVERGEFRFANEVRLRMDSLGLSQKGKRDLRWRIVEPDEDEGRAPASRSGRRDHLKVVGA